MHDALGLIGNHFDEDLDGCLETTQERRTLPCWRFGPESAGVTIPRPIGKNNVSRFHAPVDDGGLRMTSGVEVGN